MNERRTLVLGAAAAGVFWVALFAFGAARSDYTQFTKAVSELGAFGAPHALAWNLIGFITPGLLLAACGAGIATTLEGRRGALWWLFVGGGLGFAGTGVFPAVMANGSPVMLAPSTLGHIAMMLLSSVFGLIATLLLLRRVWCDPHWSHLRTAVVAGTLIALLALAANVFHDAIPQLMHRPGLAQRIGFVGHFLWYLIVAGRLAFQAAPSGARKPGPSRTTSLQPL